ncbi:MAG: hypothetical protein HYV32_04940 [Candidatus Kerfeldbacteria bacterium]|nr:hypothetical protein [Candidatus Kerfeldbacteria bacterium]
MSEFKLSKSRTPEFKKLLLTELETTGRSALDVLTTNETRFRHLLPSIEQLYDKIIALEQLEHTDDTFDRYYETLRFDVERALRNIFLSGIDPTHEILSYAEFENDPKNWLESGDPYQIFENRVIFWVPTNEDIARILAIATGIHQERIRVGEKKSTDPIEIIDVGGASGALGKLIVDMARENGFNVNYHIVDPDKKQLDSFNRIYKDEAALSYTCATTLDFLQQQYAEDTEMLPLLEKRATLLSIGKAQWKDLGHLSKAVQWSLTQSEVIGENPQEFVQQCRRIIEENFHIQLSDEVVDNLREFTDLFTIAKKKAMEKTYKAAGFIEASPIQEIFKQQHQQFIDKVNQEIDDVLKQRASKVDVVINSWMPEGMNFSSDIQAVNAGAVVYAMEINGATGIQSNCEQPRQLFDVHPSYVATQSYAPVGSWSNHSWYDIDRRVKSISNLRPPYNNALLFHARPAYRDTVKDEVSRSYEMNLGHAYPWMRVLEKLGLDQTAPILYDNEKEASLQSVLIGASDARQGWQETVLPIKDIQVLYQEFFAQNKEYIFASVLAKISESFPSSPELIKEILHSLYADHPEAFDDLRAHGIQKNIKMTIQQLIETLEPIFSQALSQRTVESQKTRVVFHRNSPLNMWETGELNFFGDWSYQQYLDEIIKNDPSLPSWIDSYGIQIDDENRCYFVTYSNASNQCLARVEITNSEITSKMLNVLKQQIA